MTLGVPYPQFVAPELAIALKDRHKSLSDKIDLIRQQQAADYLRFELMIERGYGGLDSGLKLMAERLNRMEQQNSNLSKALLEDVAESSRIVLHTFEQQQDSMNARFKDLQDNFSHYFFRSVWLMVKGWFRASRPSQ